MGAVLHIHDGLSVMDVEEVWGPNIRASKLISWVAPSNSNAKMRINLLQDLHFIQAAKLDRSYW